MIVVPEHGSFHVPQTFAGQVVAGVQHFPVSAAEHTVPDVQFAEQLTTVPVHGSVNEPQ